MGAEAAPDAGLQRVIATMPDTIVKVRMHARHSWALDAPVSPRPLIHVLCRSCRTRRLQLQVHSCPLPLRLPSSSALQQRANALAAGSAVDPNMVKLERCPPDAFSATQNRFKQTPATGSSCKRSSWTKSASCQTPRPPATLPPPSPPRPWPSQPLCRLRRRRLQLRHFTPLKPHPLTPPNPLNPLTPLPSLHAALCRRVA
jgi:hypothetical protein